MDELTNMKAENKIQKEHNEKVVNFAREIDHTKRNKYLTSHDEFQRKLKKLIKSIHNSDTQDKSVPKFSEIEKTLMKIFFKEKQEHHDR